MGSKHKTGRDDSAVKLQCTHYWVIESPGGPTSYGICKLCGARGDFKNWLPRWPSEGKTGPS